MGVSAGVADAVSSTNEWIALIQAAFPFVGGGGGAIGLYFAYRKIDSDNRKLDREKIAEQRQELVGEREEHRKTKEELRQSHEDREKLQAKLNEAYKELYPKGQKVDG